ncbi:hypothetical protein EY643_05295 [Halioglobus maricola]|uniref:DUF2946 domain-containing protein n=1 Tax=Halioglobus maricola TaxID=2601894 RepID=A0A5P9NHU6_9GAMM|nr:hypothetical protein [Halioglobus maricola]QFU75109.1 hypothetical protein EY643_05295 [Halioglobus maricola]
MNATLGKFLLCALLVLQSMAYASPMDCADVDVAQLPCHEQGLAPTPSSVDCDHCQDCRAPGPVALPTVSLPLQHGFIVSVTSSPPGQRPAPIDDIYHPPNSPNA